MNKENTLYGIIGLLAGLIIGYMGTVYLNRAYLPASSTRAAEGGTLPADHPPTSATSEASSGATAADSGATGDTANNNPGDPQADVMSAIQQARNEPTNFDAQMKAAGLYKQINRNEQAIEFYDRALKVKPNDFNLLVSLGDTNFDLQRYEEAERWYQQALKIKPTDPTVRMDMGLTFFLRQPKDLDRAIAEYRKALSYNSTHEKTLQNLTAALIEKGDKAGARETLKRLEQVNPGNSAVAQFRDRLKE